MDSPDKKLGQPRRNEHEGELIDSPVNSQINTPLPTDIVGGMDMKDSLDAIQERHHISPDSLFTSTPERSNSTWDAYYLTKLALMRLEGWTYQQIADFFSTEFAALNSKRDLFVRENTITKAASRYFSQLLKDRIDMLYTRPEWRIAADIGDDSLIRKLETKTGMERSMLFRQAPSGKKTIGHAKGHATFGNYHVLRAFSLRLEGHSYASILEELGFSDSKPMRLNLSLRIWLTFSKSALDLCSK